MSIAVKDSTNAGLVQYCISHRATLENFANHENLDDSVAVETSRPDWLPEKSGSIWELLDKSKQTVVERPIAKILRQGAWRGATFAVYADLVKVHRTDQPAPAGGKRGIIRGFSNPSRKRFLENLAMTRNQDNGAFITLTYPNEWNHDPERWKRDLDAFLKRLKRYQPGICGFWRLEFQQRGAPHYHLITFGRVAFLKDMQAWCSQAWYEIVGSGDEKHLKAGTQVRQIENRAHAMRYASKYAAKPATDLILNIHQMLELVAAKLLGASAWLLNCHLQRCTRLNQTGYGCGRFWGKFGKLDQRPLFVDEITQWDFIQFKRLAVRWLKSKHSQFCKRLARQRSSRGFSVFGLGDLSLGNLLRPLQTTIGRMLSPLSVFRFPDKPLIL